MAKPLTLFLVDDDSIDRDLFKEAVRDSAIPCLIFEDEDGGALMRRLEGTDKQPDLIILDFNMPVMDGRSTLNELKSHPIYRKIPVFILSTSNSHFDMVLAYESGASMFLVKPHHYGDLVQMMKCLLTVFVRYTPYGAYFSDH